MVHHLVRRRFEDLSADQTCLRVLEGAGRNSCLA